MTTRKPAPIFQGITANVVVLGCVSFLTDVSAEMIYPLLPMFLTQYLGAGAAFLGLIEGFAESMSAFLKLGFGVISDRSPDRSRFVLLGYTLSSFSRPFMAAALTPWHVLFVRCADRMGKGIRTSPRDALLADSAAPEVRGKAFGFQRSMDHAGAVLGPVIAALLLATGAVKDLRHLFWLAAVPGALAVALIVWRVREVRSPEERRPAAGPMRLSLPRGRMAAYLAILLLFLLSNSSDAFLLLRASQLGVPTPLIPVLWTTFSLIKAMTVMPLGMLSDRIGRRRMILAGWVLYACVYAGFGLARGTADVWALFIAYGFFYGFTEATERAFLADMTPPEERGQAFGWFNFVEGIALFPASVLFGLVWQRAGAETAFFVSAGISCAAAALLAVFISRVPRPAVSRYNT